MKPIHLSTCLLLALFATAPRVLGDGGFFFRTTANLSQTRQEVLLAFHIDATNSLPQTTYVLRSRYAGDPEAFAWVIPVPATPTDVVAHETGAVLDSLDGLTRPSFWFTGGSSDTGGGGCACGAYPIPPPLLGDGGAVEVEARGQAGIFEWAALTSTGSDALVTWLNGNGFTIPTEAGDVLNGYVEQGRHFLAVRVSEPDDIEENDDGEIEIPPIQFTCQTSERFYPMVISRISAADETEVLVYVLADHRAEAANVPNALVDPDALTYDSTTASLTNYESLFTQTIADLGGVALVTEFARSSERGWGSMSWMSPLPAELLDLPCLTRMRTVIAREQMQLDFEFQDAPSDEAVSSEFWISASGDVYYTAAVMGQPLAALLLFGLFCVVVKRRANPQRRGGNVSR